MVKCLPLQVSGNGQVEIADAIAGLTNLDSGSIVLNGEPIESIVLENEPLRGFHMFLKTGKATALFLSLM